MKKSCLNIFCVIFMLLVSIASFAQKTVKKDSIPRLKYRFNANQSGRLFLKKPSQTNIIFDKALGKFMIVEKIGSYQIKTPIFLTPKEYAKYRLKKDVKHYFQEKINATNSKKKGTKAAQKNLLPKYYVNSKFFESIFGSNTFEVIPSGQFTLKLGGIYQRTENPQIQEQNRGNLTFDFDQQISASLIAKAGKHFKISANYDTQSTFDFQNLVKLEYTATEDDIIQKIDAGNVSMPIKNSLINGAQSLFGVKTKLQFGKTKVTAIFSQQNSESKSVAIKNGVTVKPFEIRASDYDNDRHFFLSQFFRENYKATLQNYPLISSPVNVTRIEVWVTNRNATVKNFRNIIAFADIGESIPEDLVNATVVPSATTPTVIIGGQSKKIPTNQANNIATLLTDNGGIRDIATISPAVAPFNMKQGTDYSYLQNARKLLPNEYTLHPQLGFISLNGRLNSGEVLAVAYEYTVVGASNTTKNTFKVGEFSNDGVTAPKNLAVKLLRSEILTTKRPGTNRPFPTWRLMMKNVYVLGDYPLEKEGFRFELMYRDDQTGTPQNTLQNAQEVALRNKPLLNLFNLDKLDQSQYPVAGGDGFFDYIEGITVNSRKSYIIFPETEPFGKDLPVNNPADRNKYAFNALYTNVKSVAQNEYQNKDKFLLKGYFKSEVGGGGIPIGAFNVPRGSVKVTAGGRQLAEGIDYVVNYQLGTVQILDPGLKTSGIPINVSTENNSFFNQQRKTFFGVDVEHRFSEHFVIGGTWLNVKERPITQKVNFGAEPIDNTMIGLNLDYSSEVPLLTKWANKLPFVDTDATSNVSVKADMAYLIPGSPSDIDINGRATSYIDNFEASQIPINLMYSSQWFIASTPDTPTFPNFGGNLVNNLKYNDKRAKLAWYTIDQLFYGGSNKPSNIDSNELSRAETRQINSSELFRERQLDITQNASVRTLDLAFYPSERGPYNFDTTEINPNVKISGVTTLSNPQERWGGIMRPLNTNNFNQANVEYIQFWLMDPYEHYSITKNEGLLSGINPQDAINQVGELYFDLGNISEDILNDGQKQYENGLPADGIKTPLNTNDSNWGKTPKQQSILYSFDQNDNARTNQDVGLDGLRNDEEASYFSSKGVNIANLNPNDIASDNFQYFRGGTLDAKNASVLERYKSFNSPEGNSPTINQSKESFPTSATSYPDTEDINKDQTMNTVESFYQYKVSLNKADLIKGKNNIVDTKTTEVRLANGISLKTKWYQFRIPIRSGKPINGISDFNSIRFIRMFLTKFKMPVVLRFGQLELVRADWRRYTKTLDPALGTERPLNANELNKFEVGVVNIEQNENRYVLPPGILRERLQGTASVQEQNEQSVMLKVADLPTKKTRAIYKNISADLRRYKDLKMFLHAEATQVTGNLDNDDMTAIIRLGTDLNDNFYQMEIPLKVSKTGGTPIATEVWPQANNLSVVLSRLGQLRLERDKAKSPVNQLYTASSKNGQVTIRVKGNPTLAAIRTIMLGVRNDANTPKSAEIWFDELRSVGFDNKGGWAAVVSADANVADLATVSLSGKIQTTGFGNVQDRMQQRSLEDLKQYNVATNVNIGKMIPRKWHLQIPMSYVYGEEFRDPEYDPQYQDVKFVDAEKINPNSKNSQNYTRRKSISFSNVKKNRNPKSGKKPKFYDVENLSASYAFNEEYHKDYTIKRYINQNLLAGASYNFTFKPYVIEPFKKSKKIKQQYWQFIKDLNFNPVPKNLAFNARINRNYNEQKSRNLIENAGLSAQPTLTQRRFLFDWDYTIGFDLTKSLQLNFNATNNYIYDSFGAKENLAIFDKFFVVGRPDHYHQKLNATYKIPINKIPLLGFLNADYGYTADFDWKASSQDPIIINTVGNMIQNANTHNFNGNINFERFYRTIKLDRLLLKKEKKIKNTGQKILKGLYDVITSVKRGQVSYSQNNGTLLQGYKPIIGFLGRDNFNGSLAPTFGFVFGSQADIRSTALANGWLVARDSNEDYVNKRYGKTHFKKLNYTFSLRPLKSLTIDLRGDRIRTSNITEQLDVIGTRNAAGIIENTRLNPATKPFETGNFSTSYLMFPTAFESSEALFSRFLNYRSIIASRLASATQPISGFKLSGQQVLLPAFLAAYSGKDPASSSLGIFKNMPIPNWTLRYNGLMKYKWFKKHFTSFTLTHGYKSSYTISNYTSNLQYDADDITKTNTSGNYQSPLLITSTSLIESFSPLIKVEMKMRNSFSFRGEIKRDRTLTLNFNNNTLTDIGGTEYVFGLGYRIKDVKFTTHFTGKKETIKGNINLRADISLRDNVTVIRSLDVQNNQTTGGEKLFSFKFLADYILNRNLTASFYYDHQTFNYAISTTFPRQSINAGFRLTYNLGN